jgi:WD40 repeat protein
VHLGVLAYQVTFLLLHSSYTEPLDTSCSLDGANRTSWRPKEGVLLTTLKEHSGAVNRLVVSPDQAFFASASADRTVKIWQTRQLDRVAFPRYALLSHLLPYGS